MTELVILSNYKEILLVVNFSNITREKVVFFDKVHFH